MSRVRADKLVNRAGSGAPELTYGAQVLTGMGITGAGGINITGVATAGSFVGNITGDVTGNASGTAGGLTGTPDITVDGITANGVHASTSSPGAKRDNRPENIIQLLPLSPGNMIHHLRGIFGITGF